MNFLDQLLELTEEAESPRSFFVWSGLAAISAVMRKNVWVNKRLYRVYPNLFIMLIAKSALRKGYPVKTAQKLVDKTQVIKVISGQNSIQSIITELGKQWTVEDGGGKVFKDAQAFVVNDELDSLIIADPSAQTLLTTLYDSYLHPKWEKSIKKDGREVLNNLYITMLTATNEDHLDNFLEKASIKGGFLGRTLLVHENRMSRINPLIDKNNTTLEIDTEPLVEYLKYISQLEGQFKFTDDAVDFYTPWYTEFMTQVQDGTIGDETGTAGRAGDTALKLAMCLSLNERNDLIIDVQHIQKAVDLFKTALSNTRRFVEGKGKSENAEKNRIVLGYLLSQKGYKATKKQILAAKYGDIDYLELDRVTETMHQAGIIDVEISSVGNITYSINERYAKKFNERLKNGT